MFDIEKVKQSIKTLENCYYDAPLDFLGTGSDGDAADEEEMQWRDSFLSAINTLKAELGVRP